MINRSINSNNGQRRLLAEVITRASSPEYDKWWSGVVASGYCTSPIHLNRNTATGPQNTLVKCKNRRADICPICSDLYAGDTWQLVHAGIGGGHNVPSSVAQHPLVFVTLTAPSFGQAHSAPHGRTDISLPCQSKGSRTRCAHGARSGCIEHHQSGDDIVGQPICPECYDYPGQVLFTWHAPELWARFCIGLRRAVQQELVARREPRKSVRVSFVKIVELQRRGFPHFHAVIRLDDSERSPQALIPPKTSVTADDLVLLARQAASRVHLAVSGLNEDSVILRFGQQCDVQVLTVRPRLLTRSDLEPENNAGEQDLARRISGYLAKYVTKSVTDFGLTPRRFSPNLIPALDVSDHVRKLLLTITELAGTEDHKAMIDWLHTLGYRGHITTKSRQYSVTMGSLRETRATHAREKSARPPQIPMMPLGDDSLPDWKLKAIGHGTTGERFLVHSAALKAKEARWAAKQLADSGIGHER